MTLKMFYHPARCVPFLLLGGFLHGVQARAASNAPAPSAKEGTLQVQVRIPASWQPIFEDRVTEAFVNRLRDVFERQGYHGDITEVSLFDEPSPGCCLLTVDLLDWRMNMVGNVDCSFGASLQRGDKVRSLGLFSGMAFRWMNGPGRFGLADSFGDAADDALRSLYRSVEKTGLVAGTKKK